MIVVATDAPLNGRACQRLAARAVFAMARTGASYSNGSGDFGIAFSTAAGVRVKMGATQPVTGPVAGAVLPNDALSPLFQAALEATEEAIYNSMLKAETVESRGRKVEAIPVERVREILRKYRSGGK
jgi:D-aminopeptidase